MGKTEEIAMADTTTDTASVVADRLDELASGSVTKGYQTAIMDVMRRVEEQMDQQKLSRKELAERMNVHPSRVTRLLDDPDNITMRTLWRICSAVGLQPTVSVE